MEQSKFNLWRASFSFCFIDGFLSKEEEDWIIEKIDSLKFSPEQKNILIEDLKSPPKLKELLPLVTNIADRGFLVNNMRYLSKLDNHLAPQEKLKIDQLLKVITENVNLEELEAEAIVAEHESYNEDQIFVVHNKHSFFERILKGLLKKLNTADYIDPN
jgi:hypothetical protein